VSTIRLLTAASGKAGERTLSLDELDGELEGVQSGWLILGLMGAFAGGMLYYFWRQGWLGRQA